MAFLTRVKNAWNAFTSRDPTVDYGHNYYNSIRPDKNNMYYTSENSIISMIENRIAIDVASVEIHHGRKNDDGIYYEDVNSKLNDALLYSANIDQTGRAFIQDLVMSMFDEGVVAAIPVDTTDNPEKDYPGTEKRPWDVVTLRVGKVLEWSPQDVKLEAYNDLTGRKEQIWMKKKAVAIIENPFYTIMNLPNSTLKRLTRTLRNLDVLNDQNTSGKLNLLIQLPYSLRTPLKQQQAELRMRQVERQLNESKYGMAYIDQAEHVTQLNRALDNNLWNEARDLTAELYNHLGLTQAVFDGTANESAMNNYYTRTIEPILAAICTEMQRKFLSDSDIKDKQIITYLRDPFKLVSATGIGQIAQTMTANEIMTSNEIRVKVGLKPVTNDERADELINKQINQKQPPGENPATQHKDESPVINPSEEKS